MRLTCPNCGAQYEVPDDIIPTGGRDVQCSNCGNTWFQVHADMQAEDPAEAPLVEDANVETDDETPDAEPAQEETVFEEVEPPEISIEAVSEADKDFLEEDGDEEDNPDDIDLGGADWDLESEEDWTGARDDTPHNKLETPLDDEEHIEDLTAAEIEPTPEPEPETTEAEDIVEEEPEPAPKPRGLDESVKDILREEVEYEARARASEQPQSLETQGDLGLDQGDDRPPKSDASANATTSRLRRLRREDDASTAAAVAATVQSTKDTRRDLLPDIEEINSTLRSSGDGPRNPDLGQKTTNTANRARGFRLGFALVILIAGAAVFVYSSHDSLSQSYPQAAPYIESFMTSANSTRIWLDDQVTGLFLKLNAMTGKS